MISPEKVLCLIGGGVKVLAVQQKITARAFEKNLHKVVLDLDDMMHEDVIGVVLQRGLFDTQHRLFEFVTNEYSKYIHVFIQSVFTHIQQDDAVVVRIRGGVTKPRQTMIAKTGWQVVVDVVLKKEAPKPFAFTEACMAKNKKQAWLSLCDLLDCGQAPQALIGALVWQFKTLYMVKLEVVHSEQFKSIKPFTRGKTSGYANKWSVDAAQSEYQTLVFLQSDFGFAAEKLEQWVLEI